MRRKLWMMIHGRGGYTGLPLAFKGLMILGVVVIAGFLVYTTQTMVSELKASEARLANAYAGQWKRAAESTEPGEIGYLFDQIISRADFPIVVADADGEPLYWRGLSGIEERDTSQATLRKVRERMNRMAEVYPPIPITYDSLLLYNLHYGNYELIRAVARFPYIEVGFTSLFLLIAYVGFRNIKRAEQRYIWVGMAKETAHQLGTPLSSLLGWLEILRERCPAPAAGTTPDGTPMSEIVTRMEADVTRLRRVANRFSQIGSDPDRKPHDIAAVVDEVVGYFRLRLPFQGTGAQIKSSISSVPEISINPELIAWVLENLIKNALESVDPKTGLIEVEVVPYAKGGVLITVTDNGRGIPGNQQKKVFQPGFTTKKRGWGLGLTLARRIVMEYHGGDLYLEQSVPNRLTRFVVHLPA
ncbi:MAG: HAMP domain-containing sensor histidine kinase [Candidatus Zixiibacteriota bacterium]